MSIPAPRAGVDGYSSNLSGTASSVARSGPSVASPMNTTPTAQGGSNRSVSSIPTMPGGFESLPGGYNRSGNPVPALVAALVLLGAGAYWNFSVGTARIQAAAVRAWADSSTVRSVARTAAGVSASRRKTLLQSQKDSLTKAYQTAAGSVEGGAAVANNIPAEAWNALSSALVERPFKAVPVLKNTAARMESTAMPVPALANLTKDPLFKYISWGLLGAGSACGIFALIGFITPMIPRRRPQAFTPPVSPTPVVPVPAPVVAPIAVPRPGATPFPPPPDPIPTIVPPRSGSLGAGVAAVGSSSTEVTRLVKRLDELEQLSERLKDERDETRKELSWTQVALDDFKKRVSDATTMAAASAAQSAGASEQRAAQAEMRVTEAVEHINEALQRAVEAEQSISQVKEKAQTAEERAAHAEIRAHEMQFQLARAMERLADLERLAATTRLNGNGMNPIALNAPFTPAALPSPDPNGTGYTPSNVTNGTNGTNGSAKSMEAMLAAAAASPSTNGYASNGTHSAPEQEALPTVNAVTDSVETSVSPEMITIVTAPKSSSPTIPSPTIPSPTIPSPTIPSPTIPSPTRNPQHTTPQRITTSKISDIEAGLKLARSIRTRTQRASETKEGE